MSFTITNEETCRLAEELARLTGETKTGAITTALRERLARELRDRDAACLSPTSLPTTPLQHRLD